MGPVAPVSLWLQASSRPGLSHTLSAGVGVRRRVSAFGVLFFKGAHSRLRLDRLFGVADDGSGLPSESGRSINECPAVGSRSNATASGLPACSGRSAASPASRSARPSTPWPPSGLREGAPRHGSDTRFVPHPVSPPLRSASGR